MEPLDHFAANLRQLRLDRGLSQEALAAEAGVHRTEVSLLERASREPRLSTMVSLSRALEAELEELLKGIR